MTLREWAIAVFDYMAGAAATLAVIKVWPSVSVMTAEIHPAWFLVVAGLAMVASSKIATSR